MPSLRDYPTDTKISIGNRVFRKVAPGSFWREEDPVPGNCVSRPADSLRHIEDELGPHVVIGYFVDWDGHTRRVEAPGDGYSCQVCKKPSCLGVDVLDPEGFVCHEAVYYPSLDALHVVGVAIKLVG